jgi:peptidyl-tRNA hydrolase, PTH1 family
MRNAPIQVVMGLGNPGAEYSKTRHNVGFDLIDALRGKNIRQVETLHKFDSDIVVVRFGGHEIWLVKPLTYMNLSGNAAAGVVKFLGIAPEQLLVIYDCMDLSLGRFRLRKSGSGGGQKGMESVLQALQTRNVPRLRIGIGRDTEVGAVDHVLSKWNAAEKEVVAEVVEAAADAVLCTLGAGIERAMNQYNSWSPRKERECQNAEESENGPGPKEKTIV